MGHKHTPGPWRVTGTRKSLDPLIYASGNMCIASIDCYRDRCDANARLIAAAPELLSAASAALYELGVPDDTCPAPVSNAVNILRAAISMATGAK